MRRLLSSLCVVSLLLNAPKMVAAENPPGLMYSTILSGVLMDHRKGDFYLNRIQATFLPTPTAKSQSIYPYNPDDGGKLWAILADGDGGEVARYDFYAQLLKSPYWLLNSYNVTVKGTGERPASGRIHLDKGDYALTFFVEGKPFYKFPFKVDVVASSSGFDAGDFYFLDGSWSDWGYLYYRNAQPDQSIQWKIWLRNKGREPSKSVKIDVEIHRGATLVCVSRPGSSHSLSPAWQRLEFDLVFPPQGTSGGAYFKAKDLLGTSGSYTLSMSIDGEPYGKWGFEIADMKLQPTGRTVRGEADPATFVEGGIDAFWYSKQ